MNPRILIRKSLYWCFSDNMKFIGCGVTPLEAYADWLSMKSDWEFVDHFSKKLSKL